MLELFVDSKKELRIEESPLFKSSEILKNSFGTPKQFDIRTYKKYLSMVELEDLIEFQKIIKKLW